MTIFGIKYEKTRQFLKVNEITTTIIDNRAIAIAIELVIY